MKRFNYEHLFEKYHKGFKKSLILFISLLVIFAICFVLGILLANWNNRLTIMAIFSIVLVFIVFSIITVLIFGVMENYKNEKQLIYISNGFLLLIQGHVKEIKDNITTISGRVGTEIIVQDNDEEISIYYDPAFGELPFRNNDKIKVKTSNSFIVEYEVQDA